MGCNVQQTDPGAQVITHIRGVARVADVVGWNELGNTALQQAVHALPRFETFPPLPPGGQGTSAGAVSISWRTGIFALADSAAVKVHDGVEGVTPTRWIIWVALRHRVTGRVLYRLNTHVDRRIETGGRVRVTGLLVGQPDRAKGHFARLALLTGNLGGESPLLGSGDLNVDYLAESRMLVSRRTPWFPLTALSAVSTIVNRTGPTHGSRLIDWTWTRGEVTVVSQRLLPKATSDHHPVLTVIEY